MKVTPITASRFKSDGGTMFGLVPKPIWSKAITPDEDNRIQQDAHALLVQLEDGRLGLVDTGCGPAGRFSEKAVKLNGLGKGWPLDEKLTKLGVSRESIEFVVYTHLHWDHAGGASCGMEKQTELSFPNAVHYVHELEWKDATGGDPLLYKSYPEDVIEPLTRLPNAKLIKVHDDKKEILPGVSLIRSSGHTRGHCIVQLSNTSGIGLQHPEAMFMFTPRSIVFAGDVCPMQHNLRMVFQTSYDTYPLDTRAWKIKWLKKIAGEQILLMFDHDPELFGATIRADEKREYVIDKTLHTSFSPHDAKSIEDLAKRGQEKRFES